MGNGIESRIALLVCLLAALAIQPAAAQMDEIIVTAQKREQSLQDVAIAISAFSADDIEQLSLRDVGEVINFVPNAVRSSGPSTSDDGFFFFRGVGQVDNSVNVDPGVGVYIDEVYLGRIQGASFDVLDIERVEVLRGPQGTLFGRNTIGGAVSVVTRDPGDEFSLMGRLVVGDRDRADAQLQLDLPFSDRAGMTASVFTQNQDGWSTNPLTGDKYGDREDVGGRVKFVWTPGDNLLFRLSGDYTSGEGTPIPTALLDAQPFIVPGPGGPMLTFGSPLGVDFPADFTTEIDPTPFDGSTFGSVPPDMEIDRGGVSLTAEWDPGAVSFKSITAYREMDQQVHSDLDGTSYSFYDFFFGVDQDQFSQEFQLLGDAFRDRLHWLVGLYYFEEEVKNSTTAGVGTNTLIPPYPPGAPGPAVRLDGRQLDFVSNLLLEVESWAVFGQLEFDFTDRLSGIFGFRYTDDEKKQSFDNANDNRDSIWTPLLLVPLPPALAPVAQPGQILYTVSPRPGSQSQILGSPNSFKDSWDEFTPRLGLNFQVTDSVLLYGQYSTGFKAGGLQGRATPGNPLAPYDPETIETFEVGIKSLFIDDRVRLNAAAFVSKYEDIQLLVAEVVNGTPQFNTRNAGTSDITGVELEVAARPVDPVDLSLGIGWLDNEYDEIAPGAAAFGVDLNDKLPNAPEWTFNLGAQYTLAMGGAGDLALRADYNWRDDHYFQAANNPGDLQDSFGLLSLRATWMTGIDGLDVAAFVRNATDEEYYTSLSDQRPSLGVYIANPAPPREWGAELRYRFGGRR